jgi:hypothetical protein
LLSLFDAELAKDELELRGYSVLGGYMSPVNDAYKKKVHVMYGLAKKKKTYGTVSFMLMLS